MKRVLLVAGIVLSASTAFAAITGTKHDLSTNGTSSYSSGTESQVCKFCHVPHNATTPKLLWARGAVSNTTFYTNSETMNSTAAAPGATSLLCLSCHDGTQSITGSTAIVSSANLGQNMANTHPIGMVYATALAGDALGLKTLPAETPVYGGKVECASCHSVHDNTKTKFLRLSITGSTLCIACHSK